ncbi:hypothetical protein K443DRAFT_383856 [Laccaria amethystina LaAM-08-1]|uniref:Uncharacterized protein n=1 Tax=Laccaria amethystina LaAM-08-1 TaxID=1095629 RepID=A0A0C9WQV2_9AGAR|nr:hypothetical protein K443DRAFT_383856 [Laccaria amethystina LaAM-08-1]
MSMADQISSTAKNWKEKGRRLFRDLIKRPKSANDSARQSNPTRVSVSSSSGAHHGTDTGGVELTASSSNATLNRSMYCPGLLPRRSSGFSSSSRSCRRLPVRKTFIKRSRFAGFHRGSRRGQSRNRPYFGSCCKTSLDEH